jgi:Tol biopolymer transport system component
LIYALGDELLAVPFDLDTFEVLGSPIPFADNVYVQARNNAYFRVSESGTVAYATSSQSNISIVWVNRKGQENLIQQVDSRHHVLRLSPDGRRFVADDTARGGIWIHDMERGTRVLVTSAPESIMPLWNPAGSEIAFSSGEGNIYVKASDGTGEARRLAARDNTQWPLSWSPDGQFLALTDIGPAGPDIWVLSRDGGDPEPFVATSASENAAAFSSDGHWIAYQSDESGQPEIYVQPFPGPGTRVLVSNHGGKAPLWSSNGRELFYRQGTAVMAVEVRTEPTFSAGKPVMLFDGPYQADGTGHPNYDVSPDGQRFLMSRHEGRALNQIHVILNLMEELKGRVAE